MWEEEVHIYDTPGVPNNFSQYKKTQNTMLEQTQEKQTQ